MQVKQGSVGPGSELGVVLQEIAAKLAQDDWMRLATPADSSFYYIVGMKAYSEEHAGGPHHMSLSVPRQTPVSTLGEYQVHGQLAAPRSSDYYVRRAVSRLKACVDVDDDRLGQFIKGDSKDLSFLRGEIGKPGTESFQAFSDLLEAMLLAKGIDTEATVE